MELPYIQSCKVRALLACRVISNSCCYVAYGSGCQVNPSWALPHQPPLAMEICSGRLSNEELLRITSKRPIPCSTIKDFAIKSTEVPLSRIARDANRWAKLFYNHLCNVRACWLVHLCWTAVTTCWTIKLIAKTSFNKAGQTLFVYLVATSIMLRRGWNLKERMQTFCTSSRFPLTPSSFTSKGKWRRR